MIERKKKPCKRCGELRFIWAKGRCKPCDRVVRPEKHGGLAKVSDKEKERQKRYRKARKEYMTENPRCEVCGNPATDLHHKLHARYNRAIDDKRWFMSVCWQCHNKIHNSPTWAVENGYLASSKDKNDYDSRELEGH